MLPLSEGLGHTFLMPANRCNEYAQYSDGKGHETAQGVDSCVVKLNVLLERLQLA